MPILRYIFILLCFINAGCSNPSFESEKNNTNNKTETNPANQNTINWIDTLNIRVANNSMNIYDPDKLLKSIINDTLRLIEYKDYCIRNDNYAARSFAFNMLGKNMLNRSNYQMAIQYHKQAYEEALMANNNYLEALSLNMMGVVYRRKSAVKTALEYYTRALKTAEGSNNTNDYMLKSIAISTEGIGGIYRILGQYEQAILYYKKSLHHEEQLGSLLGMAIDNHNIGKTYGLMGDYNSAIFYHNKSLQYNNQMNSVFGKAICYNSLGNIAMLQKKYEEAYELFIPALKMAEQAGDSTYIVNSNINIGWYYLARHNTDSAYLYLQKAVGISKRIGYKSALLNAYNKLSELEQERYNYVKALQYYKQANVYKDAIANEKNRQYIVDLTILHDIEKHKRTIEKLKYDVMLSNKTQKSKNVVIILLGILAFGLVFLFFLKIQTIRKNKIIHNQKENLLNMQLEMKVLQNERLLAENKQKEFEKQILENELETKELAKQEKIKSMQKEIDHKNRELATAAAYAIKKNEGMNAFLNNINKLKLQNSNSEVLDKLRKDIEEQMNPDSDWDNFSLHFEEVHPDYLKNLKKKHSNLTKNELRLCSYLIMNLSNKEIALLLFVSTEAVQKAKYRLKKKFLLSTDQKLFDYLLTV